MLFGIFILTFISIQNVSAFRQCALPTSPCLDGWQYIETDVDMCASESAEDQLNYDLYCQGGFNSGLDYEYSCCNSLNQIYCGNSKQCGT